MKAYIVLVLLFTAVFSQTYDLAQYIIPNCAGPSTPASMNNGNLYQVLPAGTDSSGNGYFYVIKSSDGTGWELWSVNQNNMLIYR